MRRRLPGFTGAMLAAASVSACDAPTVPGFGPGDVYEFRLQTAPPAVMRWPAGATVHVFVASADGVRATVLQDAFSTGAAVWNARALLGEYRLARTSSLADADVVLRWSDEPAPVQTAHCEPEVSRAATTFCLTDTAPFRLRPFPLRAANAGATGRVRMLVTVLGSHSQQPERVQRLVAHELGHVLGIARHSPDARDLMYGGEIPRADPSGRDAATVQVLYHTRAEVLP